MSNNFFCGRLGKRYSTAGLQVTFIQSIKMTHSTKLKIRSHEENCFSTLPCVNSKTKRMIDILGALVGLSLTALLYLVIAPAIYLKELAKSILSEQMRGEEAKYQNLPFLNQLTVLCDLVVSICYLRINV
jgi:hypothetical protein